MQRALQLNEQPMTWAKVVLTHLEPVGLCIRAWKSKFLNFSVLSDSLGSPSTESILQLSSLEFIIKFLVLSSQKPNV